MGAVGAEAAPPPLAGQGWTLESFPGRDPGGQEAPLSAGSSVPTSTRAAEDGAGGVFKSPFGHPSPLLQPQLQSDLEVAWPAADSLNLSHVLLLCPSLNNWGPLFRRETGGRVALVIPLTRPVWLQLRFPGASVPPPGAF